MLTPKKQVTILFSVATNMTLLKRLQADAVAKFETQIHVQYINQTDLENVITNTVTAVLDEVEREVEEHGNRVLGLYGGRLPYTFFGGNEEDNRMQIYLAAHKDIIKTIIKSKRTEI